MEKELYEAIYEFEIKGNFSDAQDMLARISLEGDAEDKSEAFFLLGKIQELSETPQNATFYYRQSLENPGNARKAYFLASRIALLDSAPERLVDRRIRFDAAIQKTFPGTAPAVLLSNGKLYRLQGEKFTAEHQNFPTNADILAVTPVGVWYSLNDRKSLFFRPKDSRQPTRTYPFDSEISTVLPISSTNAMVMTEKSFAYTGNEGVRFAVENRYRGCSTAGIYPPLNELILNCPDNAMHFLNAETGEEERSISFVDPIWQTLLTEDGIFAISSSTIRHYRPPENAGLIWKHEGNTIESVIFFGSQIALLESGGNLKLLDPQTGRETARTIVDGESLVEISKGALGIFSQEGALTVLDTALHPLWHYHFGKPLSAQPIKSEGRLYLPFSSGELLPMTTLHYGKKPLLSQQYAAKATAFQSQGEWDSALVYVDSVKTLEPGNPTASYILAVNMERTGADELKRAEAWSNAVRYSYGDSKTAAAILDHYAKIIGASYARTLPLSPHTLYPNLFGAGHRLFTVDPAAQKMFAIDAASGNIRWTRELGSQETSPILSNDASHLAFANGFRVNVLELSSNGGTQYSELPGKPFQIQFADGTLYVSTWNGYFIKLLPPHYRIAWARKLFNMPFLFNFSKSAISVASLEGDWGFVNSATGQNAQPFKNIDQNVVSADLSDSLLALATDQREIRIYSPNEKEPLNIIAAPAEILSLKWISLGENPYLLVGFSNQKLCLFSLSSKEPIWTYSGNGSVYMTPVVNGNSIYIDQNSHIARISLSKGTLEFRYPTPGGAGTPFILDNTLFCTSPKRLLYAFPLSRQGSVR